VNRITTGGFQREKKDGDADGIEGKRSRRKEGVIRGKTASGVARCLEGRTETLKYILARIVEGAKLGCSLPEA